MTGVSFHFDLDRKLCISANDRLHRMVKAQRTKALRQLGYARTRDCGVRLTRPVVLRVHIGWPDARKRDRLNLAPTTKSLVDGIAPTILGDDNDDRIIEERWTSAVTRKGHIEISISFEEVPA